VFITHSAEETIQCGREIGAHLKAPALVLLSGDLGAGKTTITKGIASGFGAAREDEVTSPTFTLVHKYDAKGAPMAPERKGSRGLGTKGSQVAGHASLGDQTRSGDRSALGIKTAPVYHVDLYRIADAHEFETLGLEDVFGEEAVVIVEWAEKLALKTTWPILRIHLDHVSENERRISLEDSTNQLDANAFPE
jgi:tRNA threonylcarbamoyladenosine biosynthesis protein TsaE